MAIPLSLYIHIPWCIRKCPYCDFNSHRLPESWDQDQYIEALLKDLELDIPFIDHREIETIFIGGGTPSLIEPARIERLLAGVGSRVPVREDAEITLEANPGTTDSEAFGGFRQAGINRLSIGVQSFEMRALRNLGRIHSALEAVVAAKEATEQGFENINLDLMFGLPGQSSEEAERDIRQALELTPAQVSYYQLTVEPNTSFFNNPPSLPSDDLIWDFQVAGQRRLEAAGFSQYEISAFARRGYECRHNLNYWNFGDYIGIGAGAHGKLTDRSGRVRRRRRARSPDRYLTQARSAGAIAGESVPGESDLIFEFMLNALRLKSGFLRAIFEERTALPFSRMASRIEEAENNGLLESDGDWIKPTTLGWRFLNDLQGMFLPG